MAPQKTVPDTTPDEVLSVLSAASPMVLSGAGLAERIWQARGRTGSPTSVKRTAMLALADLIDHGDVVAGLGKQAAELGTLATAKGFRDVLYYTTVASAAAWRTRQAEALELTRQAEDLATRLGAALGQRVTSVSQCAPDRVAVVCSLDQAVSLFAAHLTA